MTVSVMTSAADDEFDTCELAKDTSEDEGHEAAMVENVVVVCEVWCVCCLDVTSSDARTFDEDGASSSCERLECGGSLRLAATTLGYGMTEIVAEVICYGVRDPAEKLTLSVKSSSMSKWVSEVGCSCDENVNSCV